MVIVCCFAASVVQLLNNLSLDKPKEKGPAIIHQLINGAIDWLFHDQLVIDRLSRGLIH